ncbi:MAG TPA: copper oxidase [Clostridiales bacterium]|nr:MAG: copper oxidase [Clostridiales bacterium GWD2_32_19]HCC06997.1 copper oxidase [Clostridiales bacterium]
MNKEYRFAATDGYIKMPDGTDHYIFGFTNITGIPENEIYSHRGKATLMAPLLEAYENDDVYLTLTNIGLPDRPDLDDSHTVHWHGFPNQIALYDGVPEASASVPVGRDFGYYYKPLNPGTYMYHCHFEPVEHIQMGMVAPLIVRPELEKALGNDGKKFAYNDLATEFNREYFLFMTELDSRVHSQVLGVQMFEWTEYSPDYWLLNGRSYPGTVDTTVGSYPSQPYTGLIQANAGEKVLLRCINLGFQQHSIELLGIPLKIVGIDAQQPKGLNGEDLSTFKNIIYIGAGMTLDVIFTAQETGTYPLFNRSHNKNINPGSSPGGMVSEVKVYPTGTLPPQERPNQ